MQACDVSLTYACKLPSSLSPLDVRPRLGIIGIEFAGVAHGVSGGIRRRGARCELRNPQAWRTV
ncbi:unnamed protein product, partial [Closterium sp. NIES-65]